MIGLDWMQNQIVLKRRQRAKFSSLLSDLGIGKKIDDQIQKEQQKKQKLLASFSAASSSSSSSSAAPSSSSSSSSQPAEKQQKKSKKLSAFGRQTATAGGEEMEISFLPGMSLNAKSRTLLPFTVCFSVFPLFLCRGFFSFAYWIGLGFD